MTICAHPHCGEPAEAACRARFRDDYYYCSSSHRTRHGELIRQKARRDAGVDREVRRARDLMSKYGIDIAEWDRLHDEQLGRCGICAIPLAEASKICTDHDHATGKVRGLLCNRCNMGLGYFGDSASNLAAALRYITPEKVAAQ